MLKTRLTEQYGLDAPLVSAPMGFIATPPLVAAVSNAGGLGLLGAAPEPPQGVEAMIASTRALTTRPFGIGFIVETTAFGPSTTAEHVDVVVGARLPVATFFWNLPPREWVDALHRAGVRVWLQVGTLERARAAVALGADAIVCQGLEAGGHNCSAASLLALVPAMVDAVRPVPVVAAGGIADGRTLAAVLLLGAEGACVGTRFIATPEANAHADHKRRIAAAGVADTRLTHIFGPEWPDARMRCLRNRVVEEWAGRDATTPPAPEPPQTIGTTPLGGGSYQMPKFSAVLPTPETTGDFEEMCLPAGEGAALARDIRPAGELVREMAADAARLLQAAR